MDAVDWLNVIKGQSLPGSADVQATVKPSLAID